MSLSIEHQVDLSARNTLALRSTAQQFVSLERAEDIPAVVEYATGQNLPLLWLGGGSNLVLGEAIPGVVAQLNLQGLELVTQAKGSVRVRASAGENWHAFVRWTLERGYFGLENLALIPGSVGASPVQNIGAYGVEVGELIESVYAYDIRRAEWVTLKAEACQFGYRDSIFKREAGRYVIASVDFLLSEVFAPRISYAPLANTLKEISSVTARDVFEAVCQIRSSKLPDPNELANAGSFFKNPVVSEAIFQELNERYPQLPNYAAQTGRKLAAGWLIEQAGLKGYQQGKVGVHALQALVLVNYGGASRSDLEALASLVKERVEQKFGIELEQEPIAYP